MKDFFISYNRKDEAWAEWIAYVLEAEGYTTIYELRDFRPGGDFVREMQKAVTTTRRTIAVLSDNYLNGTYTHPEWGNAFARDPNGEDRTLIPVRVAECEPPGVLWSRIYVDLIGLDEPKAREELLSGVSDEAPKPKKPPKFPGKRLPFPGDRSSKDAAEGTESESAAINNLHRQPFVGRQFVGRESLLKKLRTSLVKGKKAAVTQAAAIHGLGGIGKTQLAREYARRFSDEYDLIWWLKAEDPNVLVVDLAELAVPLGLLAPGQTVEDQNAIANAVLDVLSSPEWNGRWLLVYDNVESKDDLKGRMPGGDGHIIITSRDRDWRDIATPVQVEVMGKKDSRDLIKSRSGQTDNKAADAIAGRLGYLPLALEVAAAYCAATTLPLSEYVNLLNEVGLELLDSSKAIDYEAIVSKAWQPSFDKATADCQPAATLLGILSHVAPDDFPEELITDELGGRKGLNEAIRALQKYSLISRRPAKHSEFQNYLSIHRLVQDVFRSTLPADAAEESAELALRVLDTAFPHDSHDVTTWPVCDVLLPHANAVRQRVSQDKDRGEDNPLTNLLNNAFCYLYGRANYRVAEPLMRAALEIDKTSYGENHPTVAVRLGNLAQLLQDINRLEEAEPLMRTALEIDKTTYGENHPRVAIRLSNLASLLKITNRLEDAEPLMRAALEIDKTSYGENHAKVAIRLNNLAQLLKATNRLEEAEPLMRAALEIDKTFCGENHPNVARDLSNLAQLLQDTNRLEEAEPLMRAALEIDKTSYGESHPKVAGDLNNLAHLLRATNRLEEAEPLMRAALEIGKTSYGENHPYVAINLNNLAQLLQATNRLGEAEPLMRRHVKIFRDFGVQTGHEHPHMQAAVMNYGRLLDAMGLAKDEIQERIRSVMGE